MNRSKLLPGQDLGLFFTVTLWLLRASTAQAEDAVPLTVKVIGIAGSARYSSTNTAKGSWTALRVGDELRAGSVLQTDSMGSTRAAVELVGPDAHGWGKVRMLSNCVLKLLRLDLKKSDSGQTMDVRLDVPVGGYRLNSMALLITLLRSIQCVSLPLEVFRVPRKHLSSSLRRLL